MIARLVNPATLFSLGIAFVCFDVVGNVDDAQMNKRAAECEFAHTSVDSGQTVVIGKLIGYAGTPERAILVEGGVIQRIGLVDEIRSQAHHTRVIQCRDAYISPGFVNAHEHPPYSAGKPGPNVRPVYTNRYQWQGKVGSQHTEIAYERVESDAQLYWVELRHLISGTTTLAGNGAVQGLVKNAGSGDENNRFDYQADMKTFPFPQAIDAFGDLPWPYSGPSFDPELTEGTDLTSPYVPHIAEGTDKISWLEAEFFLDYVEKNPGRRYALIHGVGVSRSSVSKLRALDVTLVWAPRSNLALYGKTVDVPLLLESDVRVALSTDWSYSGSYNMLESFRCAKYIAEEQWNSRLSAQVIWRMATENGAYALNLEETTGTLKPGFAADFVIVRSKSDDPYQDLITSEVSDVIATFVDGELMSGNAEAFNVSELPSTCSNVVGDHFVCDDFSKRNFNWQEVLAANEASVPLFDPVGQARCTF